MHIQSSLFPPWITYTYLLDIVTLPHRRVNILADLDPLNLIKIEATLSLLNFNGIINESGG